MISALFLIAGIHSKTNLKTYVQAKNFFNPANTQCSSEESLKEKRCTFIGICVLFSLGSICKYLIYVIDGIGVFTIL